MIVAYPIKTISRGKRRDGRNCFPFAKVHIWSAVGTLATIYKDSLSIEESENPITTDHNGNGLFFIESGDFYVSFGGGGGGLVPSSAKEIEVPQQMPDGIPSSTEGINLSLFYNHVADNATSTYVGPWYPDGGWTGSSIDEWEYFSVGWRVPTSSIPSVPQYVKLWIAREITYITIQGDTRTDIDISSQVFSSTPQYFDTVSVAYSPKDGSSDRLSFKFIYAGLEEMPPF